ncbi:sensor histidine kinase [Nocardioides rotundus]|uniref:sensor histidine kinase n=1 Tax=Nocardioides rotundus TaxID=1774216 RepID=UPI001CBC7E43|nr:sensor histidine kinase [Nocardioides rotundus]UAL29759.1 sensor histidine kinase [Nocardioides rotundus]
MTSDVRTRLGVLMSGALRRWRPHLPWVLVLLLVLALLPTTIGVLNAHYALSGGTASALAIVQTVPLLLAVRRPLDAWYLIAPATLAGGLVLLAVDLEGLIWPYPPMEIVGYVALCLALGLRETRRTLVWVWAATAVASIGLRFLVPEGSSDSTVITIVLSGVALVLGVALRERYEAQRRLAEQETISEAERSRRTLLEERARIARELHDVVAHHMSVITVQADTATYRIAGLQPQAQAEFASIASTARESLGEMRRLLGILRSEDAIGERAPQPGLGELDHLVEATVRAGVPVEFTAADVVVPETVGLSAYRIVQEALANVVRHAPGAATRVTVAEEDERLTVVVVNGRSPEPPGAPLEAEGTGHGLVGMRERVRLVGGTLEAGPLTEGGFRVAACLPLTEGEDA